MNKFFQTKKSVFLHWWKKPATKKERVITAVLSAMAFFWISVIAWIMLAPLPTSISAILIFALTMSLLGAILGVIFPKSMRLLAFPFAFWGIGN